MNKKAVLLMSGGMDSAVVAGWAIDEGYECAALHLNYGQKTQQRELKSFHEICNHFNISNRLVVDVSFLAQIGGSSLTDDTIEVSNANPDSKSIPSSYVPFRNANILAIATSWAEVIDAEAVIIGAMEEDSSGYPDCRETFYDAFQNAINLGTKPETNIKILTPIIHSKKSDIVKKGIDLNVPFDKTWSCYKSSDVACGKCDSCHLRLKGFAEAGIKDPIPYDTE